MKLRSMQLNINETQQKHHHSAKLMWNSVQDNQLSCKKVIKKSETILFAQLNCLRALYIRCSTSKEKNLLLNAKHQENYKTVCKVCQHLLSNLWATFKVRPWLHNKKTITTTKPQQLSNSNKKMCESLWGHLTQAKYLPYSEITNDWNVPYLIFVCLQQAIFK